MRRRPLRIPTAVAVAALAITLAGCTNEPASPPNSAANSGPPTSTLRIGLTEWDINLPKASARPGTLSFTVINTGSATHELAVSQSGTRLAKTPLLAPGERTRLHVPGVRISEWMWSWM